MPQKPNFTVQLPATLREWSGVAATVGGAVLAIAGCIYAAWSDLSAHDVAHDERLAVVERTVTEMHAEVAQIRGILMTQPRAASAASAPGPAPGVVPRSAVLGAPREETP